MTFTANNGCTFCGSDAHMTSVCPMRDRSEPINYGALDPQQRMDVARGNPIAAQSAPVVPELTGAMVEAAWRSVAYKHENGDSPTKFGDLIRHHGRGPLRTALRAALAAAPQPAVPVAECTNEDSWNCKYCRKTATCEALKDERNFQDAPQPAAQDQGERYTCIGKGGNYELVGYARLAGELRGMLGGLVPDLAIYRSDTDYFARTRQDFKERMEPIAASTGQEV